MPTAEPAPVPTPARPQLSPAEPAAEPVLALSGALARKLPDFTPNEQQELPLTEHEQQQAIEYALRTARRQKYDLAKLRHYTASMARPSYPAHLTAEQYWHLFKRRAEQHAKNEGRQAFSIGEHNKQQIWLCCLYFALDPRFEAAHGYDLQRGLMLRGNVGCGKTTILELFCANARQSYTITACDEVSLRFEQKGATALEPYFGLVTSSNSDDSWGQRELGMLFDDLGVDNYQAGHFANNRNPMADVLTRRLDRSRSLPAGATHLTTNLMLDEIDAIYHARVGSRIAGGFNDIVFPSHAPDFRRQRT